MKTIFPLFSFIFLTCFTQAQTLVTTIPQNKKVILEEFTGTGCPNCPDGHVIAANILDANPGIVFVVAYHPDNSNYTSSDPMRRSFPAAFYSNPFISPSNRFMPSAIVNRRIFGTERILPRTQWVEKVNILKAESSPLNVGVASVYNTADNVLTVDIEVYFTENVTSNLTLYTVLLESNIIASQSGGTANYVHKHAFREALPSPNPEQWGEPITNPTTQGSLISLTYTFDNTSTNYDMNNCEIVVFVRDAGNGEIISGNGALVGSSTADIPESFLQNQLFSVFPNPVDETSVMSFTLHSSTNVFYEIYNSLGQIVISEELGLFEQGSHQIHPKIESLSNGVFFIRLKTDSAEQVSKIIR